MCSTSLHATYDIEYINQSEWIHYVPNYLILHY